MGQMTEQEKDNCALDYLIDKYAEKFADEFEIQDSKYADFFYGADIFYIRSKKLADDLIKVEHLKGVYTDNYIALYYLKQ